MSALVGSGSRPKASPSVSRPRTALPTARIRRARLVALTVSTAVALTGLAVVAAPATADPGSGLPTNGPSVLLTDPASATPQGYYSIAVDPYTGLGFAGTHGSVAVFDEYSGGVVGRVATNSQSTSWLALDRRRSLVWATDADGQMLLRIDERTLTVTDRIPLGATPEQVAVDEVTGMAFVSTTSGTILPVNETSNALGSAFAVGGWPRQLAVDSVTGTIFAADWGLAKVDIVDEKTGTLTATVPGQNEPSALVVDEAHDKAYLASTASYQLTVVDGAAQTVSTVTIQDDVGSHMVTGLTIDPSSQTLFVQDNGGLITFDTATGAEGYSYYRSAGWGAGYAVDPYTNTVFDLEGDWVNEWYEPLSLNASVPGLVSRGAPFSLALTAWGTGASPSFHWALASGSLPAGLSLSNGVISGTPTTAGAYDFGLTVTDEHGDSVTQSYRQVVVDVERAAGGDRFGTSVAISQAAYPDPSTAHTVYIASALGFPDALSAGPAASHDHGPLLLTLPSSLPASISQEIGRLHPAKIVVIGGVNSVSSAVYDQLSRMAPAITRYSGADRYATARDVIRQTFPSAATVYVATGANFPDSLSAGGAAGAHGEPLLLVNGGASAPDPDTVSLLQALGTTHIVIVGGTASVSAAMAQALSQYATVTRDAGGDRFGTSVAVNEDAFTSASTVLLSSGMNFPDALSASAWAGASGSPLYIAPSYCVPEATLADIYYLGATKIAATGGTAALDANAAGLSSCSAPLTLYTSAKGPDTGGAAQRSGPSALLGHPDDPTVRTAPRLRH